MRAGKHTLFRGFLWLGSASAFARLVDLAAIVVVLGVVTPEQIGQASLAWTVITLSEPLASVGVPWALLTVRTLPKRTLDTALWLAALGGLVSALGVATLAPLLGALLDAPAVTPLIAVSALKLLPAALATVPQQRLARALRHRDIAAANASATLLSALLRVVLALNGAGAWAFVIAHTAYSMVQLVVLWAIAPQRPRAQVDRARLRELLGLGVPTALGHALSQWARNIDYLFVGAFLGLVPLGLYRVAFDLAMEPAIAMGDVIARSAAPTLRKLASSREQLKGAFTYAIQLSLAIAVPLAIATFYFAPQLLELVKDASYVAASSATRWLAVAAVLRVLLGLYTPLAVAIGKPGLALRASLDQFALLSFALLLCVGALGSSLSIASAGVAWCGALALTLLITRARFRSVLRRTFPRTPLPTSAPG